MDGLVDQVAGWLQDSSWLALVGVFLGGVLSAASPCVLATIPLVIGLVIGRRDETSPARAFGFTLVFVLGLAVNFVGLGMVAALASTLYGDVPPFFTWIVAAVCLVMGLHMLGVVEIPIPQLVVDRPIASGWLGAFVLGLLFGFVSAPCAAPLLIVILTWLAGSGTSVLWGGLLLFVYALGHSVLILVVGTSMGAARKLLSSERFKRGSELAHKAAGVLVIGVGAWFAWSGIH